MPTGSVCPPGWQAWHGMGHPTPAGMLSACCRHGCCIASRCINLPLLPRLYRLCCLVSPACRQAAVCGGAGAGVCPRRPHHHRHVVPQVGGCTGRRAGGLHWGSWIISPLVPQSQQSSQTRQQRQQWQYPRQASAPARPPHPSPCLPACLLQGAVPRRGGAAARRAVAAGPHLRSLLPPRLVQHCRLRGAVQGGGDHR